MDLLAYQNQDRWERKRMNKKSIFAVMCIVLLLAVLAGCGGRQSPPASSATEGNSAAAGSAATEPAKKVKAIMILQDAGGAAWGATKESFFRGCEALGWDYEFLVPTTLNSVPEMVTLTENAVTQGCDVLITPIFYADMYSDVVSRARDKGILTISVSIAPEENPEDVLDGYVGFNADAVAKLAAEKMAETVPADEKISVVMFHQAVADMTMVAWDAFEAELVKLRPDTEFIGLEADENKPSITVDKLNALKLVYPNMNAVFGMDMGTALGIHTYVIENNLQGKFWGIGVDSSPENLGTVKAGTVQYIIDQGYSSFGEEAVELARKILDGEPYEFANDGTLAVIGIDECDQWAADHNLGEIPNL
jgi:ABC-type sugar transport system substrate-binding protein